MAFSGETICLVLSSCLILYVFGQCQQACISFSLVKDSKCSDILESRPFEVKQPGRCGSKNSEGRNAICCSNSDIWARNNILKSRAEDSLAISRGALEEEFPHQVYIQGMRGKQISRCSGTVYSRHFIITSASCLYTNSSRNFTSTQLNVIAGITSGATTYSEHDNLYPVTEVLVHPRYDPKKIYNGYDIALLKLEKTLDYEHGKIGSLKIAPKDFVPNYNEKGILLDWTNKATSKVPKMIKSFTPLHDPAHCQRITGEDSNFYNILTHQLCVAGGDTGINPFEGDISGSPVICPDHKNGHRPVLCGVASYKTCHNCKSPAVFTRISSFVDWIRKITKNEPQEMQFFPHENIGGEVVDEPEDFLVRIFSREKTCDGTLISPHLIITARNCIADTKNLESLVIIHGRSKAKMVHSSNAVDSQYSSYYMEIGTANSTNVLRTNIKKYDFAFIHLDEPFNINFYPKIPADHYEIKDAVEMSYSLKTNDLQLRSYRFVDKRECTPRYESLKVKLTAEVFCASEIYSGGSTCERALGSPLICEGKYLCGISSSRGCSFSFPNIFTDITEFNNHISETIEKMEGTQPEPDH